MKQKTKFKQTEIGKIPEDWEVKKIEEVVTKLGDGLHGTPNYDDNGDYYFINGNNLVDDKIQFNSNTKRCVKKEFDKYKKELNNRTLLVSINGTLGNLAMYHGENIILGKSACYLNAKKECSLLYIKYILKNKDFQKYMQLNATGTTIKNFSLKQMRDYKFSIPRDINEQKAIAKILSDLDAKVELNNNINRALALIGKSLFMKWFIEGKKDDWKVGCIGDGSLTELLGSGIEKFSGEKIYIATADVDEFGITDFNTKITFTDKPSRANMQPLAHSIWFAKMKDSKKVLFLDEFNEFEINNLILSTGFTGLKVKPNAFYYIWNFINNKSFENTKDNLSIGTTMQAVNNNLIKKVEMLIPEDDLLKKFNVLVKPLYLKIYGNNLQNRRLSKIRDILLPKLMNGEIRVK